VVSTLAGIGDVLTEPLGLGLEFGVFFLPEVAATLKEPSLHLLGSGVDLGFVLIDRRVHAKTPFRKR
jgi:hypothetical protein